MRRRSRSVQPGWIVKSLVTWSLAVGVLISSMAGASQNPMEVVRARPLLMDARTIADAFDPASMKHPDFFKNLSEIKPLSLTERGIRRAYGTQAVGPLVPVGRRIPTELAYADEPGFLPPAFLNDPGMPLYQPGTLRRFVKSVHTDGRTVDAAQGAVAPGGRRAAVSPVSLPALAALRPDGASPTAPRAATLASATPAPVEPEVVAMPAGFDPAVVVLPADEKARQHPNYAQLIEPEDMSREQRCLAEAVYFEARSEPPAGQAAVAQVVLNRVRSGLYPKSVCGVVFQNRNRYMACQFTFACEGKPLTITEPAAWKLAVNIARDVTEGRTYLAKVGNATHYHADYVHPYWARRMLKSDTIGRHSFYTLRPGQR